MRGARNNPNPIICTTTSDIDKERRKLKEDYNFYSRMLRVIYSKKKIREQVLNKLNEIENTAIHEIPAHRILEH